MSKNNNAEPMQPEVQAAGLKLDVNVRPIAPMGNLTIIAIAAFGIFIGATLSNGMMEIARHGIFRPEQFYFQELMCIFLAVRCV